MQPSMQQLKGQVGPEKLLANLEKPRKNMSKTDSGPKNDSDE
jgi:hypothetical protein